MKSITILGVNNTSIKMFIDFYKTIYLPSIHPDIITLNSLNSLDVIESIITESLEAVSDFKFYTLKVKENYKAENLPSMLVENSDIVIRFDNSNLEPELIKLPEPYQPIIDRWNQNIERMSHL